MSFCRPVTRSHGLAFVSLQLSFQRGTTLATAGVSTLLTNMLPILAGLTVFGEHMPGGVPGVLRGLGFASAVLGAAMLARPAPPDREDRSPPADRHMHPGRAAIVHDVRVLDQAGSSSAGRELSRSCARTAMRRASVRESSWTVTTRG